MLQQAEDEDGALDWPKGLGEKVSILEESLLCPICQVLLLYFLLHDANKFLFRIFFKN